ncbi:hypothetical protein MATL_G00026280 [Megalops atlanticus]|uniref:Uncharacterized protein n=1 Tax=Megalops atlanticus TaxID=7932 RepID=A0A9D3QD16_MEGAT|nr:hypothetical protein MATL_G00026280 [Megalops atlanticus]
MNWDTEFSSVLSAADGSVAKIRRQLTTAGRYSKDIILDKEVSRVTDFEPPLPLRPLPSPSLSPAPQWEELARIQSQLQSQSRAIESLTQALRSMESERQSQQRHLQSLQEELRRLRERDEDRERERAGERARSSPGVDRGMEQWKREVERELSSLRGRVDRAFSLSHQEESLSNKLRREEAEQLRREVDQLKQQLRRQEEDTFHQQSEARETRRQCERSWKTLESLTDSYRAHSVDLAKTIAQYQNSQQEVRQLRLSLSELKEEVRGLMLRDRHSTPVVTAQKAAVGRGDECHGAGLSSDSEDDFSPTPSLGEVSSDDLSWAPEKKPAAQEFISQLIGSDSGEAGSDLEKEDEDSLNLEGDTGALSDSPAELSLNDL